jgi:hypothetical protein
MSGMHSRHQDTSRRSANGIAGVKIGETHAFGGHLVQSRRLDQPLPIASQVAVPQVIRKDKDDVRFARLISVKACDAKLDDEKEKQKSGS